MENWSSEVTRRPAATFPPDGLFTKDAVTIYKTMRRPYISPNGLGSAIMMVQFFINRSGKSLSEHRKAVLCKAIEYLQVELSWLKQEEAFEMEKELPSVYPPPPKDKWVGGKNGYKP